MPSVAKLCEEMAAQRRWIFDDAGKDGEQRAKALGDIGTLGGLGAGWRDGDTALRQELFNQFEQERLDGATRAHFTILLLTKVILGNVLQLYFQGTFFSLSFESTGFVAKVKVLVSMALSFIIAVLRCKSTVSHLGPL